MVNRSEIEEWRKLIEGAEVKVDKKTGLDLLSKLNEHFGTENESMHEFNMDLLKGETGKLYANDESKLIALLMFLSELDDEIQSGSGGL